MIMAGLLFSPPLIHAQSYSANGFNVTAGGGSSSNSQYSVSGRFGQLTYSYTVPSSPSSNSVITWSNPANIGYGTPLGPSQLNATANVPGSFVYNPPAGTVLPAGTAHVLSVTFTPANTSNYNVATGTVTLSVLPASLTIIANNTNKVYGTGLPALTASYAGFTNGDTAASLTTPPTLATTVTASSPAGAYPITANAAVDPNYAISYVNGALTVSQAPLTITANNQSKTYGAALPALTVAYSGFVNGDTAANLTTPPSVTTTATASSPAEVYSITASSAVDPNYAISYVNGALTVSQAPLTITANNQSKTYGAALPTLTVAYSGFVNGDTAASLTTPPSVTTTATAGSPPGVYPITASAAVDPNYAISYVNGALTVSKAPLTITANNQTMTEGSHVPTLTASYSGFVNGDTAAKLTTPASLTTSATSRSSPGKYPIVVSGATSPDYAITFVNGVMTVTSRGRDALAVTPARNTMSAAQSNVGGELTVNVKSTITPTSMSVTNSKGDIISAQVEIEHLAASPDGQVRIALRGHPGQAYLLEMSTDLIHWQVLETSALPNARFVFVDQSAAGSGRRFYRLRTAR
jgi:hypothetical protein